VASATLWKTTNAGTLDAIFDGEGSYSIGCVTSTRTIPSRSGSAAGRTTPRGSVAYGDGVYKSATAQELEKCRAQAIEHVARRRRPRATRRWSTVAAQGPLWAAGGDRGLYKTTDGGPDLGSRCSRSATTRA